MKINNKIFIVILLLITIVLVGFTYEIDDTCTKHIVIYKPEEIISILNETILNLDSEVEVIYKDSKFNINKITVNEYGRTNYEVREFIEEFNKFVKSVESNISSFYGDQVSISYVMSSEEDYIKIVLDIKYPYNQDKKQELEFREIIDNYINDNLKNCSSDYDIIKRINRDIINLITYSKDKMNINTIRTPYESIISGNGVCSSYALLVHRILLECGYEAVTVKGITCNGIGHMWNMVKISNKWYHIDVTYNDWDDGKVRVKYLLKNDRFMERDRKWDHDIYPKSNYNY